MSRNDTWMPLYVGDYTADTMHLSTVQHGAYLLLLMFYWRNGPLPNDEAQLANIAGRMDAKAWRGVWPTVSQFFVANGDGRLHQKRMDKELKERDRRSQTSEERSRAGRAGAEARYGRPKDEAGNCHAFASDLPASLPDFCQQFASDLPDDLLWQSRDFVIAPVPSHSPVPVPQGSKEESNKIIKLTTYASPVPPREAVAADFSEPKAHRMEVLNTRAKLIEKLRWVDHIKPPKLTRNEQIVAITPRQRPKAYPLTPEQLALVNPARKKPV